MEVQIEAPTPSNSSDNTPLVINEAEILKLKSRTVRLGNVFLTTNVFCYNSQCFSLNGLADGEKFCYGTFTDTVLLRRGGSGFSSEQSDLQYADVSRGPIYTCYPFTEALVTPQSCVHGGIALLMTEQWPRSLSHMARDIGLLAEIEYDDIISIDGIIANYSWSQMSAVTQDMVKLATLGKFEKNSNVYMVEKVPIMPTCYSGILQKAVGRPGHPRSWNAVTENARRECNIIDPEEAYDIVILQRDVHRRDFEESELDDLMQTVKSLLGSQSSKMSIRQASFDKATFCEQVRILTNSAVFIAAHGQAVAGNIHYLNTNGLFIELFPFNETVFSLVHMKDLYGTAAQGRFVGSGYLAMNVLLNSKGQHFPSFNHYRTGTTVQFGANLEILKCVLSQVVTCRKSHTEYCSCLHLNECHESFREKLCN